MISDYSETERKFKITTDNYVTEFETVHTFTSSPARITAARVFDFQPKGTGFDP